ncbi:MAG: hypothetical protein JW984_12120 [Deltaproteobacteria bacterium]|uniref:Tetratricopeptide repeat protein n=1 Tax=Candidatus Zymogenus saltonus TaxID=2844893 RepID=A0A9D8PP37_9DELT|nr:hypothetical protein [Candidatus Zymogenus saltonus]
MADDKAGIRGAGGVGPKAPKPASPVVGKKSIPVVIRGPSHLGTRVITPEMEKYQSMLAKNPSSRVFAALAECYRKQGMLDEAIHLCVEGVKKYPNYMSGRVALGRAYFDKGMIKEAKEELEKVVSITPNNIVANKVLGDVHLFEEDINGAGVFFGKVLSMSPEDEEVAAKLKDVKAGINPLSAAIKEAKKEEEGEAKAVEEEVLEGKQAEQAAQGAERETIEVGPDSAEPAGEVRKIENEAADEEILEDIEEVEPEPDEEELGIYEEEGELDLEEGGEDIEAGGVDEDIFTEDEQIRFTEVDEIPLDSEPAETVGEDELDISADDVEVVDLTEGEGYGESAGGEEADLDDEFGILDEVFTSGEGMDDLSRAVEEFSQMEEGAVEVEIETKPPEDFEEEEAEIAEFGDETAVEDTVSEDYYDDVEEVRPADMEEYEDKSSAGNLGGEVDISTETIADIYVKQGYFDRALAIYEDLSDAFPTRRTLKEKLSHVRKKLNELGRITATEGKGEISMEDEEALGDTAVVSEDILNSNIQSLQKWLQNVRKYRRMT